jgi:hypothetical protein
VMHFWKEIGVPTQSHPQAASFTFSAWNIKTLVRESEKGSETKSRLRKAGCVYIFDAGLVRCNAVWTCR